MITIRSFRQIAFVDTETGALKERRLLPREAAEEFYRGLAAAGQRVRVGMEASGHARFKRLLSKLQFELRMGDAAEIRRLRLILDQLLPSLPRSPDRSPRNSPATAPQNVGNAP